MKKSAWQRVDFDGYYTFKNTETGEVLKKQFVDLPYDENHKKSDIDLINEMSDYKIVADAETEGWFVFNASQNKRLRGRAVTAVVQCHKDGQNNYENIYRIDREKDITYFLIIDLNRNRILKTMMMGKKSGCLVLRKPQNIFYNNFDLYVGSLHPFILYDIFSDKSWKLESNLGYLDDCLVVKLYDEKKYRYFDVFTKTLSKPLKIYSAVDNKEGYIAATRNKNDEFHIYNPQTDTLLTYPISKEMLKNGDGAIFESMKAYPEEFALLPTHILKYQSTYKKAVAGVRAGIDKFLKEENMSDEAVERAIDIETIMQKKIEQEKIVVQKQKEAAKNFKIKNLNDGGKV